LENTTIKEWYTITFPTDELGCELSDDVTFKDLLIVLENHKEVYDLLGVSDSIVRERVFEKLSEMMNVDYDYVYNLWLKG
jgi:hypothetical protein